MNVLQLNLIRDQSSHAILQLKSNSRGVNNAGSSLGMSQGSGGGSEQQCFIN